MPWYNPRSWFGGNKYKPLPPYDDDDDDTPGISVEPEEDNPLHPSMVELDEISPIDPENPNDRPSSSTTPASHATKVSEGRDNKGIKVTISPGGPDDSASNPIDLENINLESDEQYVRLQKLKQQWSTQELQKDSTIPLTKELFAEIANSIKKNIETTRDKGSQNRHERYDESAKQEFSKAVQHKSVHGNVKVGNPNEHDLTITLSDANTITATFKPNENKVLIAATDSGDQSLIILLESALKAAKKMHSKTLIVYPCSDLEQTAKLCMMAKYVGLTPVFRPDPDMDVKIRDHAFNDFKSQFQQRFHVDDPAALPSNKLVKEQEKLNPISGKEKRPAPAVPVAPAETPTAKDPEAPTEATPAKSTTHKP
jgi:hypothetical protein